MYFLTEKSYPLHTNPPETDRQYTVYNAKVIIYYNYRASIVIVHCGVT